MQIAENMMGYKIGRGEYPTTLRQIKVFLRVARDSQQLNARPRDSSTLDAREGYFPEPL
jgi:hypothetical protein